MSTFSTYDSTVNSFYLAFYGRPADPAGLAFWSQHLAASNGELGVITQAFAASEEAQVRFGADSVNERISEIYQQLFNRAIDADGLAYWTGVVEQGNASLADVSMSILKGAIGSDATLSALRQQAADDFTAQVEASGTQYSGYASIEAARILVRAVTADATQTDVAQLVKAAVSFADTATKTPQVVEAIAVNTTLLALFDTARGKGDPVALAQALADTAKAAAGDPVTLESLLRGGGMDKVLKVMPAAATLKDVVKALADGGLPAAVEVVYPTAPTAPEVTPTPTPTPVPVWSLTFKSVSEDDADLNKGDHVTNVKYANIEFDLKGKNVAGQTFKYTTDEGKSWKEATLDSKTHTVIAHEVDLSLGNPIVASNPSADGNGQAGNTLEAIEQYDNRATTITLQAFDAKGTQVAEITKMIVYDYHAASPVVTPAENANIYFDVDVPHVASIKQLKVSGIEADARVEFRVVETLQRSENNNEEMENWSPIVPELDDGEHTIAVRVIDVAGNASDEQQITFVLDSKAPVGTPSIALAVDDGVSDDDGITTVGTVNISNLESGYGNGWQYSTDEGKTWTFGGYSSKSGTATFDLGMLEKSTGELLISQIDAAGNTGDYSNALDFTYNRRIGSSLWEYDFNLAAPKDSVTLLTYDGTKITGFNNAETLILKSRALTGTDVTNPTDYLAGPDFGLKGDVLTFNGQLTTGLYALYWKDDTFTTETGYVGQMGVSFAGGQNGLFIQEGFHYYYSTDVSYTDRSYDDNNNSYLYQDKFGVTTTRLMTGGGHDVVADNGSTLTLAYDSFDSAAQDLIFGFDQGNDTIALEGLLGKAVDHDKDGTISWLLAESGRTTVASGTEAVEFVTTGTIVMGAAPGSEGSLGALNNALNVSAIARDDSLLILAKNANGTAGALFLYTNTDGDDHIDAKDLTEIAMFSGGAPDILDIEVIGTKAQTIEV